MQDTQTTAIHLIRSTKVCWNEPGLNEMLADPMTQLLMRRDGVQEAEIRRLVARLRQSEAHRSRVERTAPRGGDLRDEQVGDEAAGSV